MDDQTEVKKILLACDELQSHIGSAINLIGIKLFVKRNRETQEREISEAEIKAFQEFGDSIRERSTDTIAILEKCLHRFAKVSDICEINLHPEPPGPYAPNPYPPIDRLRLIGTSAHHAGVLFLRKCLASDFLDKLTDIGLPDISHKWLEIRHGIDFPSLMIRMDWERMKAFDTSDFQPNATHTVVPSIEEFIEDANSNGNDIKPGFHSRTEEIPSMFKDENGEPFCRLRGNQTQLAHAIDLSDYRFKTQASNQSIWVIQHSPNDLELLVHKMDRDKIEGYRKRLDEYESAPPKKKTSRKRKQK